MSRTQSAKLQGIEAARGIAALLVALYHSARHLRLEFGSMPLGGIAQFGHAGVDFFFVLSGFIILYIHQGDLGRPESLGHYAARRFLRVFPFYWIVLGVTLALLALSPDQHFPGLAELGANLLLVPHSGEPAVGVAWTLEHEILFYLIFAVAIWNRRAGLVLMAGWFMLVAAGFAGYRPLVEWGVMACLSSSFAIQFFMGMGAAWLVRTGRVAAPRPLLAAGIAAFFAVGLAENMGRVDGYAAYARLLYGLSSMAVVVGLAETERRHGLSVPAPLVVLGGASYALYLVHLLCIGIVWKALQVLDLTHAWPVWALYAVLVTAAVAGGVVASRVVEQPAMALCRAMRLPFIAPPRTL